MRTATPTKVINPVWSYVKVRNQEITLKNITLYAPRAKLVDSALVLLWNCRAYNCSSNDLIDRTDGTIREKTPANNYIRAP